MNGQYKKPMLPPPAFANTQPKIPSPHFASPAGMLLPKDNQPPPMYGPQGATIPAQFLKQYKPYYEKYNKKFLERNNDNCPRQRMSCDGCEQNFNNKFLFDKHNSETRNCSIDGCSFRGCPKLLMKHVNDMHSSGLYEKIKNLNTPEEIEKWKEERRKRYPTVANVMLRQQAQEERRKRGERLEGNRGRFASKEERNKINRGVNNELKRKNHTDSNDHTISNKKPFGKQNDRRHHRNNDANTSTESQHRKPVERETAAKEVPKSNIHTEDDDDEDNVRLPKFKGTSCIPDYKRRVEEKKPIVKNVLTGLLGMYGESSSDSDDCDSENEIPSTETLNDTNSKEEENVEINLNSEESRNSDKSIATNDRLEDYEMDSKENEAVPSSSLFEEVNKEIATMPINQRDTACTSEMAHNSEIDNSLVEEPANQSDHNEETDDMPEEQPIQRESNVVVIEKKESIPNDSKPNSENIPKYNKQFSKKSNERDANKFGGRSKVREVGNLIDYSLLRKTPQNTLLEKLLEPEIRHERNVLLQCVRYIVKNNFFGIGGEEKSDEINTTNEDVIT